MEKRVTGLGGVFFKAADPKQLTQWYDQHLGLNFGKNTYQSFLWRERENPNEIGSTAFSVFKQESDYYAPSKSSFMFNFRVENLTKLLELLRGEGVTIVGDMETYEYGKFAWILDPEGNKIELWEPIDQVLEDYEAANP